MFVFLSVGVNYFKKEIIGIFLKSKVYFARFSYLRKQTESYLIFPHCKMVENMGDVLRRHKGYLLHYIIVGGEGEETSFQIQWPPVPVLATRCR